MNKENSDIINKFLFIGDKCMPEMHLWDPKVKKYSACGPFTRHQKRIDMFMKDGRLSHILKNKKGESIVEGFKKILKDSGNVLHPNRKPNKIWVHHGSEFYNNKFKSFLKENDIEMYSTYNEGKSVVAERFIKTLKNKIYKHMTTIGKNVYFNDLDDIVDKYNNTVHSSIKMKPKGVNDDSFV